MDPLRWIKMSLLFILILKFTAQQNSPDLNVRVGDEVELPCGNVIQNQHNCNCTTWIFSIYQTTVALFEHGQIHKDAASKSDRLSVTAECSLVIEKVAAEDAGLYVCRQFVSGHQHGSDSARRLSVSNRDESTQKSITAQTEKTSVDRHTPINSNLSEQTVSLWWILIVAVGSATILILIFFWKKTKGNKKKEENAELSLNPAVTQTAPETSQEMADPEDGVSYASISFTYPTRQNEEVSDTVTYSTVKASSSSVGVSIDPNSLYSTVNKPRK